ncbi:hypothetical protein FNH22_17575 [Fulvivirga sp. M361]|uniref:hypothetical protein n=1 Tax=Fulvivirga sp. M361 TaxID=2594266 RepID=UPI00117A2FD3|nr:hypothetical protein [Fulvivirga sp. M361]TRX55973.1 hypothetical protein FNH22_17575 [Fulvivirga sp. M361]
MKNQNVFKAALALLLLAFGPGLVAQDAGFIYGKITTAEGDTYEGPLRWGKEEVYWTDMFNASKEDNDNIDYLSREDLRALERYYYERHDRDWGDRFVSWFGHGWSNGRRYYGNDYLHQFSCQFGEIRSLKLSGRNWVYVELRNGDRFEVKGEGYNDVGTNVKVIDKEVGEMEVRWSRIERIDFMDTPKKLDEKFGEPLYGTVETYQGIFTGYVQWDHDERVSTDRLDGDTRDGDLSIAFGRIKSIESDGNSSFVVLNSGREFNLRGSNDVNSGNRGIIVSSVKYGRVDIPWREFKKVTFEKAKEPMISFAAFKSQKALKGTVNTTTGDTHSGKIVYDLDEAFDYEVLQGADDEIEYIIPFRLIKSVIPKSYKRSIVELKSGEKLELGDRQDVSDRNTGILVFDNDSEDDPTYVLWKDIDKVTFN